MPLHQEPTYKIGILTQGIQLDMYRLLHIDYHEPVLQADPIRLLVTKDNIGGYCVQAIQVGPEFTVSSPHPRAGHEWHAP
jgi:hypothetical protein